MPETPITDILTRVLDKAAVRIHTAAARIRERLIDRGDFDADTADDIEELAKVAAALSSSTDQ